MIFRIKIKYIDSYIRTDIDSAGMDAYLVRDPHQADKWNDRKDAEAFLVRLKEHFPTHKDDLEVYEDNQNP